jgi:flagellin
MSANIAANAMTRNERTMSQTMERLSTGIRINSAKDDAAGLAISSKMTSQIRGLNQAVRNANDAIGMIQVEEGAMKEVSNMLQRMRELAVQAISDSNTTSDRAALDAEFTQLASEIQRVGTNTQWNGANLIDGTKGASSFQIGANAGQTVSHTFAAVGTAVIANSSPSVAATVDAGSNAEKFTVTLDDGAAFAVDDTLSFNVNGFVFSANVDAVDGDGDVSAMTFHGSSTQITEAGTENFGVLNITGTNAAGIVKVNISADNVITFEGSTAHADADFTLTMVDAYSDATTVTNSTSSRGLAAGAMFADISTSLGAQNAIKTVDHALGKVDAARASSGAVMNRLEYAADNLTNVSQNSAAARSRIMDADYASETTELARTQIIQQAATAMLAQANQSQQAVLALLS